MTALLGTMSRSTCKMHEGQLEVSYLEHEQRQQQGTGGSLAWQHEHKHTQHTARPIRSLALLKAMKRSKHKQVIPAMTQHMQKHK